MKYDHVIRMLEADLAEYRSDLKRSELHRPEWVKGYAEIVSELESAIALLRREQEKEDEHGN